MLPNVRAIDVDLGRLADVDHVVVEGDEIVEMVTSDQLESVRAATPARASSTVEGGSSCPGLSDIHRHVSSATEFGVAARQIRHLDGQRVRNVGAALEKGCTFVRDCGGAVEQLGHLRSEIEAGRLVGPRSSPR